MKAAARLFRPGILLSAMTGLAVSAHGQATERPDTTKTYVLPEMVVTGTRTSVARDALPSSVALITRVQIDALPGATVGAVLGGVAGVSLRTYGGPGGLQTVTLRGMGPEHSLVLVDGQRYTNPQNDQTDVGILLSSDIERIEVGKGGYSSLYGADAIGGVINIVTRRPREGLHGEIATSSGSYGLCGLDAAVTGADSVLGWRLNGHRERGAGDYAFDFTDGAKTTPARRSGSDFDIWSLEGKVEFTPREDLRSSLMLSYAKADRGTPGAVTDLFTEGTARLDDATGRLHLNVDYTASPVLTLSLNTSVYDTKETYADPALLINNAPLAGNYATNGWNLSPELRVSVSPALAGVIGTEISGASISSSDVHSAVRRGTGFSLASQHIIPTGDAPFYELVVYPSLRYDTFSDVGSDVSGRLGVNVGLIRSPEIRLRSSVARSFRAPTFNELYWIQGGNPALSPERSVSVDCGATGTIGPLALDAGYFSISTRDRIVWTPGIGGIWSPENIARVRSDGFETEIRWSAFQGSLQLAANSSWITATKESEDYPGDPTRGRSLIYVPRQTVNLQALLSAGVTTLSIQHSWTSFRYTTEINDRFLPRYGVLSAALAVRYPLGATVLSLKCEATNLLNTSYEVIALYPMPLRQFRGTIGMSL